MLHLGDYVDFTWEPVGPHRRGELGAEDFEGDLAVMLEVLSQIHGRHPAHADFALNAVATAEGGGEKIELVGIGAMTRMVQVALAEDVTEAEELQAILGATATPLTAIRRSTDSFGHKER